ncbi:tripartite motif-containing protein 16-like [Scomber scombrus]|uniref:tripartite motif-containing protein 16-like n=1 Tax=Scomber scombrus TaxID=13677 RepID=UPI002DDA58B2|nr:tripartite motif-containing protein 16-like [Scomber scombrus]
MFTKFSVHKRGGYYGGYQDGYHGGYYGGYYGGYQNGYYGGYQDGHYGGYYTSLYERYRTSPSSADQRSCALFSINRLHQSAKESLSQCHWAIRQCGLWKLRAFKSCENHLQPHYDAAPLKKHKLDVTAAVSELRDKLQDILRDEWTNISLRETEVDVLLSEPEPEPKTRAEFLKYSCEITLDPNTVNTWLLLSEGNKKVTYMSQQQSYSSHPDRLIYRYQVLSKESLTGRCYWEVERRGGGVRVAVAYKNIKRKELSNECIFGFNDKSWALYCSTNSYNFWFNNIKTPVSGPGSSRVGVYLDHRAGILSFYSVSETMTLLHRVQTTFTQPLYAGLYLYNVGDTAELCKLK